MSPERGWSICWSALLFWGDGKRDVPGISLSVSNFQLGQFSPKFSFFLSSSPGSMRCCGPVKPPRLPNTPSLRPTMRLPIALPPSRTTPGPPTLPTGAGAGGVVCIWVEGQGARGHRSCLLPWSLGNPYSWDSRRWVRRNLIGRYLCVYMCRKGTDF